MRHLEELRKLLWREVALRPDEYRRTALLRGAFAAPQRELGKGDAGLASGALKCSFYLNFLEEFEKDWH